MKGENVRRMLLTVILTCWTLTAHAATVHLSWTGSATPEVTGYRMYYGIATATYTVNQDAGLSLTGTIGGLTEGTTYYIAVKAYTATGQESAFSNEVVVPITVDPLDPNAPIKAIIMPRVVSQ